MNVSSLSVFCLWNVKIIEIRKSGKLWTTFLSDARLIGCNTTTVELAVPTASASNIRNTRTPHHNVRLPEYREPSLRLEDDELPVWLREADLAIERQCSCAVEQQHDR